MGIYHSELTVQFLLSRARSAARHPLTRCACLCCQRAQSLAPRPCVPPRPISTFIFYTLFPDILEFPSQRKRSYFLVTTIVRDFFYSAISGRGVMFNCNARRHFFVIHTLKSRIMNHLLFLILVNCSFT